MAGYRKLGRSSDQRSAMLRSLATDLIWHGKIETTEMRAKEVRKLVEKLVTIAVKEHGNVVEVQKTVFNEKAQSEEIMVKNDSPSKLAARRRILSVLYNYQMPQNAKESRAEYKERVADINHPVIEKLFGELAPKYAKRNQDSGAKGGYTRIYKLGPRRGDAAEMVIIELV
ncbi:MAG: L17 family ribosomal protein [Eubacteriales bacterium]|nr:L17 family ribosomal protein [Eubacteriales bacterium]